MNAPILPPRGYVEDCSAVIDAEVVLQSLAAEQPEAWMRYSQMGDPRLFAPVRQVFADGDVTLSVALHWRRGAVRLAWQRPAGPGAQVVEMEGILSAVAGIRWWFCCPQSGRTCAKLYLPSAAHGFAGRQALGLAYRSETGGGWERERHRAVKLRQALGESPAAVGSAVPSRPLGMGAATYQRAIEALRECEAFAPHVRGR
jgi:hypothetical protein